MTHTFKVGDLVEIVDHSDAHGDVGRIWIIQDNGIIIVELEECVWPVDADQIRAITGNNREAARTLTTGVVSLSGISETPPLCFTLLPCPFCYATPHFIEQPYDYGFTKYQDEKWDVACGTSGCYLENGADWFLTQETAAILWNRRVSPSLRITTGVTNTELSDLGS